MATGTKLMKEISDQFLICKICLETFKEPKTLVCLHTFCSGCLQKQIDADSTRPSRYGVYSRYITCPLCRQKTEIPSGGVRRLQDNFLVSNLTEVVQKRTRCKVPPCEICHTVRPRRNEACSKCLDCSKLLCKNCVDLHMTTKVTQKHSLIDIEGEKDIECKSHPEEIVRFYCEPCEKCICVVCTFQDHRDHEVCCFSDGFEKYKAALDTLLQQCKGRMGETGQRLKVIEKYESVIKEIRERIRDLAISYISKVRSTERELLKKIDDLVGDNVLQFIENKNWLQENYENLQSTCNLTQIIMKDKGVEMLLLKKEIQQKMSLLLEPNLPSVPSDMMTQVNFVPGDVRLGYISVSNGSDVNGVEDDFMESKCQQTQTEVDQIRTVVDSATTMSSDVTRKVVDGEVQTDRVEHSSRETCTEIPEMRDRGVNVYCYDSKTKGTMTSIMDSRSLKTQTEKMIVYDQYIQTMPVDEPSRDVSASASGRGNRSAIKPSSATGGLSGRVDAAISSPKTSIRSRKIQTEISSIGINSDDDVISSLSARGYASDWRSTRREREQNRQAPVEKVDVEVNTIYPVRVIPEMLEKETSSDLVVMKDTFTMAVPDAKTINTQTLRVRRRDTGIGTDYSGQASKVTWTEKVNCVDTETTMPPVRLETKGTWTEKLSTSERATITTCVNTSDRATSTGKVNQGDKTTQASPESRLKATNTMKTMIHDKEIQTKPYTKDSRTSPVKELNGDTKTVTQSVATVTDLPSSRRGSSVSVERAPCHDMNVGTECVERETKTTETCDIHVLTSCVSTETLDVKTSDKETGTPRVHFVDQWTTTPQPQMINTGVSPPRPATIEMGVCTNPVITMESATYTEVVTMRDNGTETIITVADNETLTERLVMTDAQTGVEIKTEDSETSTDIIKLHDEGSMTTEILVYDKPETECKETQVTPDRELLSGKKMSVVQEVQTDISKIDCAICEHQSLFMEEKHFADSCTMPQMPLTQDVGTMALSIISNTFDVTDCETQTSTITLYDKCVSTSTDFEDFENQLRCESRDAATSTESLPYIGLLSEIDVDDIIVVPEAHFDFMLDDLTTDEEDVEMVDSETWTDSFEIAEAGTQTLVLASPPDSSPPQKRREEPLGHSVSVGVNTVSKMTFEKETSTPIRHLFSKGTMTFYVAKTDKATSTFSQTKQIADSKFGGSTSQKNIIPKIRVEDKDTMTARAERHDVSTETDPAAPDGRITQCISKLRNVSEKLNSPTLRGCEGDVFFGKSFLSRTRGSDSSGQSSPTVMVDSTGSCKDGKMSPVSPSEDERRKQLQLLLAETKAILKPKEHPHQDQDPNKLKHIRNERSPVRKPQPITTLKGRGQNKSKDNVGYRTQSLPRQFSVDCPSTVRLGSQSPTSRLPLLRYNSAPGRIATVPTQKLQDMKKVSQNNQHRGTSPSKIPVKASQGDPQPSPQPELYSQAQKTAKPQQRPSLPAICETRTPSSCSDISTSSYMSAASGDSATLSLTPSNISSSDPQTDFSEKRQTSKESAGESADEVPKPLPPQKKEKGMGFMQRLLSKKKKEPEAKNAPPPVSSPGASAAAAKYRQKQSKPEPPKETPLPKKSRPFVYVRQRIMSIQHDNEDEMEEKKKSKAKSKQKKEKPEKTPSSPKCKHGSKGKKSRDSDSDLSDKH
ncbi:uncharacterized protein LOC124141428 [Haliotis rufescens]|uniref:uncharacterized protein LOC124141428 n=1 Tax=Haliotis rufescens TaxID=6454 RepID=UPI00201EBDDD|nr:uncharacterized protein LOC124141428 [Haliotis rufescens]